MSDTKLTLGQCLCEEGVLDITNSLYCCLYSVFTLNLSVIRLVDSCFHSTISLQKKTAELKDVNNRVVLIEAVSIVKHILTAQTQYVRREDVTWIRFKDG